MGLADATAPQQILYWAGGRPDLTYEEFRELKALTGQRVHIVFTDGQEILANLNEIALLPTGEHLLYDQVEWSALPHNEIGSGAFYASAGEIVSVTAVEAAPVA